MGYRFNRLDEPVFMAVSKPLLTEFCIHHRLESCEGNPNICRIHEKIKQDLINEYFWGKRPDLSESPHAHYLPLHAVLKWDYMATFMDNYISEESKR